MPNYSFYCPDCDSEYEKIMTVKDYENKRHCCPGCGAVGNTVLYPPAVHMRYSLMHPRHMRGQKGGDKSREGRRLK